LQRILDKANLHGYIAKYRQGILMKIIDKFHHQICKKLKGGEL
jgi:hypothetical protein